jgi:hypothetical protein
MRRLTHRGFARLAWAGVALYLVLFWSAVIYALGWLS